MVKIGTASLYLCMCFCAGIAQAAVLELAEHNIHYQIWDNSKSAESPQVILLSGPNSSWHSDSAWWGSLAVKLADTHKVIAIDRAGVVLAQKNAKLGYSQFAKDLVQVFDKLVVKNATVVAFASGSLAVQQYLSQNPETTAVSQAILLDPDVLTDFSINRYQQDALPFKHNLAKYETYINSGQYTARVQQKNTADMQKLQTLAEQDLLVDWVYVNKLFEARLAINNQVNLFREIALYDKDLAKTAQSTWPSHIPLIIIDSHFEQEAIDNAEDEKLKAGLAAWQKDGKAYYQALVESVTAGQYIEVQSQQHLYQFAEPAELIKLLN